MDTIDSDKCLATERGFDFASRSAPSSQADGRSAADLEHAA
jgi:hypothetical protein